MRMTPRPSPRLSAATPAVLATLLVAALVAASPALPAAAQEPGFSLGPRASTAGVGAELSLPLGSSTRGRLAAGVGTYGLEFESEVVTYEGDLDLSTLLAVIDLHPGGGAFRVSLGALVNDSTLKGEAPVTEVLRDQGIVVPGGLDLGTLRARADVEPVAPYLGIGWGDTPRGAGAGGWYASLDLGVAWHGEPDVTLELATSVPIQLVPGGPQLLQEVLAEEERELEEELSDYPFYPVVGLAIGYRF